MNIQSQRTIFLVLFVCFSISLFGQKFFTRTGEITFHSEAPLEKIEAVNNTVTSVLDTETNRLQFAALIKAFQFEKALMQEHFNENYLESSKFPKATFKGEIKADEKIDWTKSGSYNVKSVGELTIHGVTHQIDIPAKITINGNRVSATSVFTVLLSDYGVEIPAVVADNIAKEVEIKVNTNLEPLKE